MTRQGEPRAGTRRKAPLPCRNVGLASALLATLANPTRLAIVCLLAEGDRSVAQIEEALGIGQPTLSQQLGVLRSAGAATGVRRARAVVYRLSDDRLRTLVAVLRDIFTELLPAATAPAARRDAMLARLAEQEMM